MNAKAQRKRQAREARLAAERHEQETRRRQRRIQLAAIGGLSVLLVAGLIILSQAGGGDNTNVAGTSAQVEALLEGVPQDGTVLGDPDARYTLTEFGDLQCPFCKQFSVEVLPRVIDDYVRSGRLKIDFQALTFIGPDSEEAARMAAAVGEQGRYWDFVDLFYQNQGVENSGYVDEEFLSEIAGEIRGVDVEQALADRESPVVTRTLESANTAAERLGVSSTPTFAIAAQGSTPQPLDLQTLDSDEFADRLEEFISANR